MNETKAQAEARHLAFYRKCEAQVNKMMRAEGVINGGAVLDGPIRAWHEYAAKNPGAYAALGYRGGAR